MLLYYRNCIVGIDKKCIQTWPILWQERGYYESSIRNYKKGHNNEHFHL